MTAVTIHVYLPEEAVDCWYPVQAEHLGGDRYRILEEPENDPVLEFHKGEIVAMSIAKTRCWRGVHRRAGRLRDFGLRQPSCQLVHPGGITRTAGKRKSAEFIEVSCTFRSVP